MHLSDLNEFYDFMGSQQSSRSSLIDLCKCSRHFIFGCRILTTSDENLSKCAELKSRGSV